MIGSFRIGSVLGISVRIHVTLLAVMLLVAMGQMSRGAQGFDVALDLVVLFGCVLLHELGHSVVAQSFGVRVVDITLWPLGGMARMTAIPESSKIEALIAVAGPMVNFVLAAIALVLALTFHSPHLWLALFVNLAMGVFNLVPAFPMDGGRVLRAFLGRRGDWVGATRAAVRVGRAFALVMAAVGVLHIATSDGVDGLWMLPVLALFLWWAGEQELFAVLWRHGQHPLSGAARFFGRGSSESRSEWGDGAPASQPVSRRAGEPAGAGFSEDEIGRLEQFRGPLSQYRRER